MTSAKWVCLGILMASVSAAAQSQAQPSQTQAGQFRVMRSESGSKGEQHGDNFELSDPRTTFRYPADKQVIVSFEWEGPTGMHHFQGTWRSPDGKVASVENEDWEAKDTLLRAHWTLNLPENVVPGAWTLEAQIDGQSAGVKSFQVRVDEGALQANLPSMADIFRRAKASMVFVDSLDANGNRLNRGAGFFISTNLVATAFANIDGASALNVELPGGKHERLTEVAGWNRPLGWALLRVNAPEVDPLEEAKADSWRAGDIDYLMDDPVEGGWAMQPVRITGVLPLPKGAERLHLSWAGYATALGAPLLSAQGKVVGMLSGPSLNPNVYDRPELFNEPPSGIRPAEGGTSLVVVPITAVAPMPPSGRPVALAEFASHSLFMAPLARDPQIVSAVIGGSFQWKLSEGLKKWDPYHIEYPTAQDVRNEFSRKEGSMALVLTWLPTANRKTTVEMRIYDSGNNLVGKGTPQQITLKRDQGFYSALEGSISGLAPGIYRVEVFTGDQIQWRGYFAVTE
ncbi:MAG: trypsin-like peptidase domain-containing protein [Candidatus Acidiferrales bacterium]